MLLGADAGLRRGEIIALEQTDADYRRGQLSVARSDWCGVVGSPKGGGDGERVTETTLRGWMERSERAGGLPVTGHIHRLRHTFCSHLAMRGAPAKAIQELAGHADLSTTMRYMHLSPASLNQAIQLLEQRAVSPANTRGENGGRTPSSEANRKNHVLDRKRPHRDSNARTQFHANPATVHAYCAVTLGSRGSAVEHELTRFDGVRQESTLFGEK